MVVYPPITHSHSFTPPNEHFRCEDEQVLVLVLRRRQGGEEPPLQDEPPRPAAAAADHRRPYPRRLSVDAGPQLIQDAILGCYTGNNHIIICIYSNGMP